MLRILQRAPLSLAGRQEPHELATEVRAVARASEHVRRLLPEAAPRIGAILERAQELHDQVAQERPALAHGDFKLDHIWLAPEALTLIDLDRCGVADPAFDMGKLLADLHWCHLTAPRAAVERAQRHFLNGYVAAPSSPRLRRARVYEAILLVKIAARRVPLFDRRWRALTEALIARAENVLAELENDCRQARRSKRWAPGE
jgi:aminoglycoside phosphotransferase (APT) family kinase protein